MTVSPALIKMTRTRKLPFAHASPRRDATPVTCFQTQNGELPCPRPPPHRTKNSGYQVSRMPSDTHAELKIGCQATYGDTVSILFSFKKGSMYRFCLEYGKFIEVCVGDAYLIPGSMNLPTRSGIGGCYPRLMLNAAIGRSRWTGQTESISSFRLTMACFLPFECRWD